MASTTPAVPTVSLCDYCHQKPKHGAYAFCSKTCAAQTQTSLCNHCQKKPKYQNFEFCGKNCAALAAAASGGKNPPATSKPAVRTAPASGNGAQAPATNSLIDPIQLAKLVAQHIPQVQNFLAAVTQPAAAAAAPPPPAYAPQAAVVPGPAPVAVTPTPPPPPPAPATANKPAGTKSVPRNNPFINASAQPPVPAAAAVSSSPAPNANVNANTSAPTAPPTQPLDCLIPGCGKPVHVDSSGAMSDYCSQKHREEAVSSGIVSACIMCLTRPQSDTDYFCGRDCREEAMNKPADP
ncbi:hypothetical protein FB45DRAFT_261481 [Roridomyces roridus]|uniref:Uncharacterized protein n=1 Tax=Roridomyces roridus TaxID=1738132 RepID=A0AAD7B8L8_9AGAR|nr:hypothetical protein FB45DRAFT_261481 [Roridomyces roridus]